MLARDLSCGTQLSRPNLRAPEQMKEPAGRNSSLEYSLQSARGKRARCTLVLHLRPCAVARKTSWKSGRAFTLLIEGPAPLWVCDFWSEAARGRQLRQVAGESHPSAAYNRGTVTARICHCLPAQARPCLGKDRPAPRAGVGTRGWTACCRKSIANVERTRK